MYIFFNKVKLKTKRHFSLKKTLIACRLVGADNSVRPHLDTVTIFTEKNAMLSNVLLWIYELQI